MNISLTTNNARHLSSKVNYVDVNKLLHLSSVFCSILIIICWQAAPWVSVIETLPILYCISTVLWLGATVCGRTENALSVVIAFYFCVLVAIPAAVQIEWQHFPFPTVYGEREIAAGFGCLALAQIPFGLVALLSRDQRLCSHPSATSERAAFFSDSKTWPYFSWCLLITITIGAAGILLAGPQAFMSHRFSDAITFEGTTEQIKFIVRSIMVVAATIVAALYRYARPAFSRADIQWVSIIAVALFLFAHYPPALARFQLLGGYIAVLIVLIPLRSVAQKLLIVTTGAFFLLYVFHGIKYIGTPDKMLTLMREQEAKDYLTTTDFDSYQQVVNTWLYHSAGWSRPFDSLLGTIFFWIPRSIWQDKPDTTGIEVARALSYPYVNVASPLPAEALAAAGLTGIVVVSTLVAIGVRWMDTKYVQLQDSGSLLIPLYAVLTGFATIILRGSLTATVPMFGTAIVTAALIVPGYYFYRASLPRKVHRVKHSPSAKQVVWAAVGEAPRRTTVAAHGMRDS